MNVCASHYSGCGNNFLLIDDREMLLPTLSAPTVTKICADHAVDGLILIKPSSQYDVRMQYHNCDGKEAEMCGNGARCLLQFLRQKRAWSTPNCTVETLSGKITLRQAGPNITVTMPAMLLLEEDIRLPFQDQEWILHHIDTGVPHVVIFVDDVETVDVETIGRYFRHHSHFSPQGTNVNFVSITTPFSIRTFERGVERETLACGTGACAAGIALHTIHGTYPPIRLQVRSKDILEVDITPSRLELKGSAHWVSDHVLSIANQ